MTRSCSTHGCTRPRSPYDRRCRPCATAAQAAYRARHRTTLAARERGRTFSATQRALRHARSTLAVYLARGKIRRGRCELCAETEVRPAWDDPGWPLVVRWFCPEHYNEHGQLRREVAAGRTAVAARFAALHAAIAALPESEQRALHEAARGGLDGSGAAPGSLRYGIALQHAYQARAQGERFF